LNSLAYYEICIEGENVKVEAVILDNGDRLSADIVIAGIGVQPATDFLKGANLNLH